MTPDDAPQKVAAVPCPFCGCQEVIVDEVRAGIYVVRALCDTAERGLRSPPREPTEAMVNAGLSAIYESAGGYVARTKNAWRAMWDAAPTINEGGQDAATREDADGAGQPGLIPCPVPPSPDAPAPDAGELERLLRVPLMRDGLDLPVANKDRATAADAIERLTRERDEAHGVAQACEIRAEKAERERDEALKQAEHWKAARQAAIAGGNILRDECERLREQFQRETLRTSEYAALLDRWVERGQALGCTHESWVKACDTCHLMAETRRLRDAPINVASAQINEGGQDAATREDADGAGQPGLIPCPVPPSPAAPAPDADLLNWMGRTVSDMTDAAYDGLKAKDAEIARLTRERDEARVECERLRALLRNVVRDADRFEDEGSLNWVHPTTIKAARAAIDAARAEGK